MIKSGKSGKKKKGRKPKAVPVYAFDLDSTSLNDLKKYVSKLEKELATMRKDCAFHSENKEKIMHFLVTMREVCAAQKKASVVGNSHVDDLIEALRRFPEAHNERAVISEKEEAINKSENMFSHFLERNTAKADHLDEEYVLKQKISDVDKRLELSRHFYETTMMDSKELLRNAQEELDEKYSKILERSLKQYANEALKIDHDFHADNVEMLMSIWDLKKQPGEIRESFVDEIKYLQNFFYEISSNNNEVLKMLRGKLEDLLAEEKNLSLALKIILQENVKLQEVQPPGFYENRCMKTPVRVSNSNTKDMQIEKKLQKLQFQNDLLKEQLYFSKENLENLKKEFIQATRRIYQKADFEAYILEEIIKMKLQFESFEPKIEETRSIPTETEVKEKDEDACDAINVFSLRVEDSDTLFVPPVYHEFWDPSLKKQFKGKALKKTNHR